MLRIRVSGFHWDPRLHELRHHLGDVFCVVVFIRQLSILTCLRYGDAINVKTTTLELFVRQRTLGVAGRG